MLIIPFMDDRVDSNYTLFLTGQIDRFHLKSKWVEHILSKRVNPGFTLSLMGQRCGFELNYNGLKFV